jgi:hypothetical protein
MLLVRTIALLLGLAQSTGAIPASHLGAQWETNSPVRVRYFRLFFYSYFCNFNFCLARWPLRPTLPQWDPNAHPKEPFL